MRRLLLVGVTLIAAGSLVQAPAFAKERKAAAASRSVAARTALCKADCRPENYHNSGLGMHGLYRDYNRYDPHLVSIEGKKQFALCVKHCVDPLPEVYVQRPVFALGFNWFGKNADSCLDCHAKKK